MATPAGGADHVLLHLGAYVLDALRPDETTAVAEHLADCTGCRLEAERLADVRAWLDQLSADDVMQILTDNPGYSATPHRLDRRPPIR